MSDDLAELIESLSHPDAALRTQAAERLCGMGEAAQRAAVALARACADEDESVLEWSTAALEELGPPAVEDIPALCNLLSNAASDTAYWAATLLGRLEARAADAVAALAACLRESPHGNVRQRAAWALGKIGPQAGSAKDALIAAASGDDARLARLANDALEKVDS